jgi:hypothetical protein
MGHYAYPSEVSLLRDGVSGSKDSSSLDIYTPIALEIVALRS